MRRVEALKPRVSFADLQRMPEDGNRYELYDGELRVVAAPLPKHQIVSQRLNEVLIAYRRHRGGRVLYAPLDIVLTDYDVLQPDLVYFLAETDRRLRPDEYVRFVPDLAVEIISPSTAWLDRGRKRTLLERHGLPEYWIVDPETNRLEASVLKNGRYGTPRIVDGGPYESPTLAGLVVDVALLFEDLF